MRRVRLLIIGLLAWPCVTLAQPTFQHVFRGGLMPKANLHEFPNGNIHFGFSGALGISILAPDGAFMHIRSYSLDTLWGFRSIRPYQDSVFYFSSAYRKDQCGSNSGSKYEYPTLGRMDSQGNILWAKHYVFEDQPCLMSAGDLSITRTQEIITWGTRDKGFFAILTDSTGEPGWAKRFPNQGGFHFIKELPGGDLIAGISMDTAGATVARMTADGEFLWCKSYIRPRGMIHDVLIESDSSFVVTGYTDSTSSTNGFAPNPASFQPKLFMMKLNGTGAVQWCRGYDSAPYYWYTHKPSHARRTLDGNYAVVAGLAVPGYHQPYRPFLMKTDLNGDTLWTGSVGRIGYSYYPLSLLEYSDGGYMMAGMVFGNLPGGNSGLPFLIKSDQFGDFGCYDRYHAVEVVDLFPTDSSFTLTPIDGVTVHPVFVRDSVPPVPTIYDFCNGFSTGLLPSASKARRPVIRPNPTTGHFTVEFPDPLMAQSYYSVFDSMGRLLYQRPLPTGATLEEVDLSRFGRGTYTIRFTSPEGVQHERVVLE
ncbi:MAG: T9SS type A sorting domain-containing protein [Flavobacteriales bacterium]|nr:T9SS type A sorting domain-containing protein [Flavobacteriales bacterium]